MPTIRAAVVAAASAIAAAAPLTPEARLRLTHASSDEVHVPED